MGGEGGTTMRKRGKVQYWGNHGGGDGMAMRKRWGVRGTTTRKRWEVQKVQS